MSKKRKTPKPPKQPAILFEIEEDAEKMFLEALENIDLSLKEEDPADLPVKKNQPKKPPKRTIDLHNLTLDEATRAVDSLFRELLSRGEQCEIMVITGKGLHSEEPGGVLIKWIPRYIRETYGNFISWMEESPDAVRLGDKPLRGHFRLILKP